MFYVLVREGEGVGDGGRQGFRADHLIERRGRCTSVEDGHLLDVGGERVDDTLQWKVWCCFEEGDLVHTLNLVHTFNLVHALCSRVSPTSIHFLTHP